MRVILVRHGETTGQSSIRYHGASDVPLSDVGIAQMEAVRNALIDEDFDAVFSSRLARSRRGAEIVGRGRPVVAVRAFDEVHFGRWEGWTRAEIAARDPDNFRRWQAERDAFQYPGGESRRDFVARVRRGWADVLPRLDGLGQALMVLHRGVIAVLLAELLRLSVDERAALGIELGSIHVVRRSEAAWIAEQLNAVAHLPAPR